MRKGRIILVLGIILFAAGWAVRSTVIMHSYDNKPIGGAIITVGFVLIAWGILKLVKT